MNEIWFLYKYLYLKITHFVITLELNYSNSKFIQYSCSWWKKKYDSLTWIKISFCMDASMFTLFTPWQCTIIRLNGMLGLNRRTKWLEKRNKTSHLIRRLTNQPQSEQKKMEILFRYLSLTALKWVRFSNDNGPTKWILLQWKVCRHWTRRILEIRSKWHGGIYFKPFNRKQIMRT